MLLNADSGILRALDFEFELHKYALVNANIWNRIFGYGPCHFHDNHFTLYLIQGLSDVEESESMKIRLDEKVINDGPMNLEPDFVRRIALNIRKGAKFSIEQEGSQIWT